MNTPSLVIIILSGVLVAVGAYMVMDRTLTRIIIGLSLMGHGVNVLFLAASGRSRRPALLSDGADPTLMSDPLPQAMMLTAIVIGLGTSAFGMALAYRSWRLSGHDEVVDDIEDRRLARRLATDRMDEHVVDKASGEEDPDICYDTEVAEFLGPGEIHDQEGKR